MVIEKITPATVIIEVAIAWRIPWAPSALMAKILENLPTTSAWTRLSSSTRAIPKMPEAKTRQVGRNQKLEWSLSHSCSNRFIRRAC